MITRGECFPFPCKIWLFIVTIFISVIADLKEMCELLGIEQSVLERAFSYRTVEAKLEKVSTTLNVAQVRGRVTVVMFLAPVKPMHVCPTYVDILTHTHTHTRIRR